MKLFRLRAGLVFGPNVLSAGLYRLRGWWTVIFFPLDFNSVAVRLPVRALEPWR